MEGNFWRAELFVTPRTPLPTVESVESLSTVVLQVAVASHLSLRQLSKLSTVETDELSEQEIVQKALAQLASFLEDDGLLTLNQHKLFADALSQYIKLKMLLPQQGENEENYGQYDLREFLAGCTDEELAIVQPVIAAVQQRKQAMEDEKVKPMRKIG